MWIPDWKTYLINILIQANKTPVIFLVILHDFRTIINNRGTSKQENHPLFGIENTRIPFPFKVFSRRNIMLNNSYKIEISRCQRFYNLYLECSIPKD